MRRMNASGRVLDPVTQVELEVPSFATPESTIERAEKRRQGELRTIRLSPDWAHEWPLWELGSDKYAIDPGDLSLSDDLVSDLRAWHDHWEISFTPSMRWSTDAEGDQWRLRGDQLLDRLEQELWLEAEVVGAYRRY